MLLRVLLIGRLRRETSLNDKDTKLFIYLCVLVTCGSNFDLAL